MGEARKEWGKDEQRPEERKKQKETKNRTLRVPITMSMTVRNK